mmetsp:Transcript_10186/g.30067  ORF Transcript_10186/g.30067 Transcript_10186/m.30067 type:complete len:221 (+) Transcript_10186:683-1345(+)
MPPIHIWRGGEDLRTRAERVGPPPATEVERYRRRWRGTGTPHHDLGVGRHRSQGKFSVKRLVHLVSHGLELQLAKFRGRPYLVHVLEHVGAQGEALVAIHEPEEHDGRFVKALLVAGNWNAVHEVITFAAREFAVKDEEHLPDDIDVSLPALRACCFVCRSAVFVDDDALKASRSVRRGSHRGLRIQSGVHCARIRQEGGWPRVGTREQTMFLPARAALR